MIKIENDESEEMKLDVKQYLLEKIKISLDHSIPRQVFINLNVEEYLDDVANAVVYSFSTYLAGQKRKEERVTEIMKIPITWWEGFKEHFAPIWFLKRWPVQYDIIPIKWIITTTNICPHIEIPPNDKKHFEIFTMAL